ncbi:hypothetical protein WJX74_008296 [Apatococcus lobatus]|uniref:Uncharacterized protein n=1 Tax=Apatococcus lobatus TaxID=904363 RepID=A0AAW1RBU1_9CHLO
MPATARSEQGNFELHKASQGCGEALTAEAGCLALCRSWIFTVERHGQGWFEYPQVSAGLKAEADVMQASMLDIGLSLASPTASMMGSFAPASLEDLAAGSLLQSPTASMLAGSETSSGFRPEHDDPVTCSSATSPTQQPLGRSDAGEDTHLGHSLGIGRHNGIAEHATHQFAASAAVLAATEGEMQQPKARCHPTLGDHAAAANGAAAANSNSQSAILPQDADQLPRPQYHRPQAHTDTAAAAADRSQFAGAWGDSYVNPGMTQDCSCPPEPLRHSSPQTTAADSSCCKDADLTDDELPCSGQAFLREPCKGLASVPAAALQRQHDCMAHCTGNGARPVQESPAAGSLKDIAAGPTSALQRQQAPLPNSRPGGPKPVRASPAAELLVDPPAGPTSTLQRQRIQPHHCRPDVLESQQKVLATTPVMQQHGTSIIPCSSLPGACPMLQPAAAKGEDCTTGPSILHGNYMEDPDMTEDDEPLHRGSGPTAIPPTPLSPSVGEETSKRLAAPLSSVHPQQVDEDDPDATQDDSPGLVHEVPMVELGQADEHHRTNPAVGDDQVNGTQVGSCREPAEMLQGSLQTPSWSPMSVADAHSQWGGNAHNTRPAVADAHPQREGGPLHSRSAMEADKGRPATHSATDISDTDAASTHQETATEDEPRVSPKRHGTKPVASPVSQCLPIGRRLRSALNLPAQKPMQKLTEPLRRYKITDPLEPADQPGRPSLANKENLSCGTAPVHPAVGLTRDLRGQGAASRMLQDSCSKVPECELPTMPYPLPAQNASHQEGVSALAAYERDRSSSAQGHVMPLMPMHSLPTATAQAEEQAACPAHPSSTVTVGSGHKDIHVDAQRHVLADLPLPLHIARPSSDPDDKTCGLGHASAEGHKKRPGAAFKRWRQKKVKRGSLQDIWSRKALQA